MHSETFLFYDLETFGINQQLDRIASFSAIRTDMNFNIVDEPIDIYCRMTPDYLPNPQSVLVHKLTPEFLLENGVRECQLAKIIYEEFNKDGTIVVGYNNIRFDDGFVNNLFYRNFYNMYEFHASRWDMMDVVLTVHDFKKDCLKWHHHEDGKTSFSLENISKANNFLHETPHASLSDVYATIAIAQAIKEKEPKLFNYLLNNRFKGNVEKMIKLENPEPFLHVSRQFLSTKGSTSIVLPLMANAANRKIFMYDLRFDPTLFLKLDKYEVRKRLYTSRSVLSDDNERMHLKEISTNRCPIVLPLSVLSDEMANLLGIDIVKCMHHAKILKENLLKARENLLPLDGVVNGNEEKSEPSDVDLQIYSGFFSYSERRAFNEVRKCPKEDILTRQFNFDDERSQKLLYRYIGRNYPDVFDANGLEKWRKFCADRLTFPISSETLTLKSFREEIARLAKNANECDKKLLDSLYVYGRKVEKTLLKSVITFTD